MHRNHLPFFCLLLTVLSCITGVTKRDVKTDYGNLLDLELPTVGFTPNKFRADIKRGLVLAKPYESVLVNETELNWLCVNDPVRLWAISAAVKKLACSGLILIKYSNEGTVVLPKKLKDMTNQY